MFGIDGAGGGENSELDQLRMAKQKLETAQQALAKLNADLFDARTENQPTIGLENSIKEQHLEIRELEAKVDHLENPSRTGLPTEPGAIGARLSERKRQVSQDSWDPSSDR